MRRRACLVPQGISTSDSSDGNTPIVSIRRSDSVDHVYRRNDLYIKRLERIYNVIYKSLIFRWLGDISLRNTHEFPCSEPVPQTFSRRPKSRLTSRINPVYEQVIHFRN